MISKEYLLKMGWAEIERLPMQPAEYDGTNVDCYVCRNIQDCVECIYCDECAECKECVSCYGCICCCKCVECV